jgi:hypothetical protein
MDQLRLHIDTMSDWNWIREEYLSQWYPNLTFFGNGLDNVSTGLATISLQTINGTKTESYKTIDITFRKTQNDNESYTFLIVPSGPCPPLPDMMMDNSIASWALSYSAILRLPQVFKGGAQAEDALSESVMNAPMSSTVPNFSPSFSNASNLSLRITEEKHWSSAWRCWSI